MKTNLESIIHQASARLSQASEEMTSRKPSPQKWSAKEILGHLIDSASVNHERFLRVWLADGLILLGYPQDDFVRLEAWQERPWSEIVTLWQALNLHLAHLIERLPEAILQHRFTVGQNTVTLEFLTEDYLAHLEHHLRQIWQRLVQIRPATLEDAEPIAQLVRQVWAGRVAANSSGHQETAAKVELDLQKGFGWVALEGESVVGSVRLMRHPHEIGVYEIKKLGVLSEYRKLGLAHQLMDTLFKKAFQVRAKELRLAVRYDQPRLVEWYQQFGFQHEPNLVYSAANPSTPPPFVMVKKLEVLS